MSAHERLTAQLEAAKALLEAGQTEAARAGLTALQADPEIQDLGQMTSLGLPRRLQAALLKLAKREGDHLRRVGYQYHLVPPPEALARFTSFSADERRAIADANRQSVPPIIHQIWIGTLPVPFSPTAWADHAHAQGYGYKLWREDDLAEIGLGQNRTYRDMLARGDYPGAVDVARYVILEQEGGIYLDCDWYPARTDISFHDLLPMTGLAAMPEEIPRNTGMGGLLLANSVLIAPPHHPVFIRLNAVLGDVLDAMPDAPAWWTTGPLIFTLMCRGGSVTLADAAFVSANLRRRAPYAEVMACCKTALEQDGGLLIAWKSW